jgi:Spy/CpxP family protein refolding chaperone
MNYYKLSMLPKSLLVIAFTSLAMATFNASAENRNEHNKERSMHGHHQSAKFSMFKRIAKQLDLTKDQRQQIKGIFGQAKVEKQDNRENMAIFKDAMQELMRATEFDEHAFKEIYAEHQTTLEEKIMSKAKTRHAIFQVLTEVQQDKFLAIKESRRPLFD